MRSRVPAATVTLRGTLRDGVLSGTIAALGLQFSVPVQATSGASAGVAGFYRAQSLGTSAATVSFIIGAQNQVVVVATSGAVAFGGSATLAADGSYTLNTPVTGGVATARGQISATDATASGSLAVPGQPDAVWVGASATVVRTDRLINLSSLTRAGSGERTLITGFVVRGTEPRTLVVRGIGPGLTSFGVADALANPRLSVLRGAEVVAQNDDWSAGPEAAALAAAFSRLGAFPLTAGSADAALQVSLAPGNYTIQITDPRGEGTALAEIYDAGPASTASRLVNISTRASVAGSTQILTSGFVITGNTAKRVLVRAVGPDLVRFGVSGALGDPRLTVVRAGVTVAENDNWVGAEVDAATAASGAFALTPGSRDAALVLTLAPGAYTAQVAGVGAAIGIVLLEIYELP